MSDWTASQWIFMPLWFISNAVVALSIIGLLLGAVVSVVRPHPVPVADEKANTPKQRY